MADIFQEVEEDLRRDRAEKAWKKYGKYVIALAVLVIVSVGGWRGLEWYRLQQSEAAGARFEDALELARAGKTAEAEAAFAALAKEAPAGYMVLARFRTAAEIARRDAAEGVKAFGALAGDPTIGSLLQDLAKLRIAFIEVDSKAYAELQPVLEPMAAPTSAWRHCARELLGLSAWKAKDFTNASKWFLAVTADPDVPSTMRQRAEVMLQLISADAPAPAGS
jgi:hypothetical protein